MSRMNGKKTHTHTYIHTYIHKCLKKNLNASRPPSEHPPVSGENNKKFGWDHRLQRQQNLFIAFKRVPRCSSKPQRLSESPSSLDRVYDGDLQYGELFYVI